LAKKNISHCEMFCVFWEGEKKLSRYVIEKVVDSENSSFQ